MLKALAKKAALLAALTLAPALTSPAQTLIDLKRGGGLRAKTLDDYRTRARDAWQEREDSLEYTDHIRRTLNALYTDSLAEAEKHINAALKLRPDAPGNHILQYYLGEIDLKRGRYDEAISRFTALLDKMPEFHDARIARADAALQAGRAREAAEDAGQLIVPRPRWVVPDDVSERALFVRAAARYQLRQYPEARTDLTALLRDNPSRTDAQLLEALTLHRMGQPREALNRLNVTVAAHPDDIEALTTRAMVEGELQLNDMARADYDRLAALCPDAPDVFTERARILIRLDEKTAARRDLDRAVALGTPMGAVQSLYNLTRQ